MDEHYVLFPPDFRPLPQHAGLFQGDNMAQKHPGFAAVQKKIEASGHSKESAGAILASASRGASKSAKSKNPRLAKVK
jgi:hypothetical protein